MPLTDIVAKLNLANKENKENEARDGKTPDREAADPKAVVAAKSKVAAADAEEPLLKENPRRFVILPIQ